MLRSYFLIRNLFNLPLLLLDALQKPSFRVKKEIRWPDLFEKKAEISQFQSQEVIFESE